VDAGARLLFACVLLFVREFRKTLRKGAWRPGFGWCITPPAGRYADPARECEVATPRTWLLSEG